MTTIDRPFKRCSGNNLFETGSDVAMETASERQCSSTKEMDEETKLRMPGNEIEKLFTAHGFCGLDSVRVVRSACEVF